MAKTKNKKKVANPLEKRGKRTPNQPRSKNKPGQGRPTRVQQQEKKAATQRNVAAFRGAGFTGLQASAAAQPKRRSNGAQNRMDIDGDTGTFKEGGKKKKKQSIGETAIAIEQDAAVVERFLITNKIKDTTTDCHTDTSEEAVKHVENPAQIKFMQSNIRKLKAAFEKAKYQTMAKGRWPFETNVVKPPDPTIGKIGVEYPDAGAWQLKPHGFVIPEYENPELFPSGTPPCKWHGTGSCVRRKGLVAPRRGSA